MLADKYVLSWMILAVVASGLAMASSRSDGASWWWVFMTAAVVCVFAEVVAAIFSVLG